MTELALDTQLTPEQHDYLKLVHSSALGLLTIINDILDFSKVWLFQLRKLSTDIYIMFNYDLFIRLKLESLILSKLTCL